MLFPWMYKTGLNGLRFTGICWLENELNRGKPHFRVDTVHSVDFLLEKVFRGTNFVVPNMDFKYGWCQETVGIILMPEWFEGGVPVREKEPQPEDLSGIDVMIFDMQDVGVRFYTYLSTLHYVMEACAEQIFIDRDGPS